MSTSVNASTSPSAMFIWARLGGGHKTAKDALQERLVREYAAKGQKLDTSADYDIAGDKILNSVWLPFVGRLGDRAANSWNDAQKAGNISFLTRFASLNWIGELLMYPIVYFRVKKLLSEMKTKPEHIICTQAFCLNAIASAVLSINRAKKWDMRIDVHLTDLPSKRATHFFPSIRRATRWKALRNIITIHSPKPLIRKGASEAKFWEKHTRSAHVITSDIYPIRRAFTETKALGEKLSQPSTTVMLKLNHKDEAEILDCGTKNPATNTYDIPIQQKDKVGFLMLGSQPTTDSVLAWLKTIVTESQKSKDNHYFFLYCGAPEKDSKNPLLTAVREEIEKSRTSLQLPKNLHIVPFTNQDADVISFLMARSDLTITRSGGATSMELLQLHQSPNIPIRKNCCSFIHSEALPPAKTATDRSSREKLINKKMRRLKRREKYTHLKDEPLRKIAIEKLLLEKGIILWESKNASYLKKKLGAEIVNPEFARESIRQKFYGHPIED